MFFVVVVVVVVVVDDESNEINRSNISAGGEGCVAMVYGVNHEKMNCDHLFNLFCLYGNVVKVTFRLPVSIKSYVSILNFTKFSHGPPKVRFFLLQRFLAVSLCREDNSVVVPL